MDFPVVSFKSEYSLKKTTGFFLKYNDNENLDFAKTLHWKNGKKAWNSKIWSIITYLDSEKDTGVKNLLSSSGLQPFYVTSARRLHNMLRKGVKEYKKVM
jgi:hypothetical protein